MGGLALKHLGVQRIPAEKYHELAIRVQQRFVNLFGRRPLVIPSYKNKPDFGDCDMMIVSSDLPQKWREGLAAASSSIGWLVNGDVTSMEIENVQFDFISVPKHSIDHAYTYFAYNDLGNLMGRIAHKMGFKYGHSGLHHSLKDDKDQVFAKVLVTDTPEEVFEFLGYDYTRWQQGFDSLSDIFEFTASSKYFHPDIYLLHNRNATSRIRDAKRKTYTEFLKWCEHTPGLTRYPWPPTDTAFLDTAHFLKKALLRWPNFEERVSKERELHCKHLDLKTRWNGDKVKSWTGLEGKALGEFMVMVKSHEDFEEATQSSDTLEPLVKNCLAAFTQRKS